MVDKKMIPSWSAHFGAQWFPKAEQCWINIVNCKYDHVLFGERRTAYLHQLSEKP